jgi:6-phosphogluconolactonase
VFHTKARAADVERETYPIGVPPRNMAAVRNVGQGTLEVYESADETARAVVRELLLGAREAIATHGSFVIVIPGGTTFLSAGRLLADEFSPAVDERWHVFQGDEHAGLPHSDPENNFRAAWEQGGWKTLVDAGRLPAGNVHRMRTEDDEGHILDIDELRTACLTYEYDFRKTLGDHGGPDLLILGMGDNGHTASILPQRGAIESPVWREQGVFCAIKYPKAFGLRAPHRITLTPRLVDSATHVVLFVLGSAKAVTLGRLVLGREDAKRLPARLAVDAQGRIICDRLARPSFYL